MNANAPQPEFAAPRVAPNQANAFGGVWRLTAWRFLSRGHLLATAGMLLVLAVITGLAVEPRNAGGYLEWIGDFYLAVVVPVLAFLSGAGAMRDEMKPGAVDYVFTRPVRRWAFVGFKYAAHMVCTQITWLGAFGVLVIFGLQRGVPDFGTAFATVLFAQMLTIAGFMAFGFFCAVLLSRYLIAGLVYAGVVEVGIGNIPAPLSRLSMTRQVRELVQPLFDGSPDGASATQALAAGGAMLVFVAAFLALAAVLFSLQEMTGARAKE